MKEEFKEWIPSFCVPNLISHYNYHLGEKWTWSSLFLVLPFRDQLVAESNIPYNFFYHDLKIDLKTDLKDLKDLKDSDLKKTKKTNVITNLSSMIQIPFTLESRRILEFDSRSHSKRIEK